MLDLQQAFREYVHLDRKRTGDGVTPEEFQRWEALRKLLDERFGKGTGKGTAKAGSGSERRESLRIPTRLKVSFDSEIGLAEAVMTNVSRGGLFISTAFPLERGTCLDLRIRIESTGETLVVPVEVVSNNVGRGFNTGNLGMGVRFLNPTPELRKKLDDFYADLGAGIDEP